MDDLDVSSYSARELSEHLAVYGTEREKLLITRFSELNTEIDYLTDQIESTGYEYSELEAELDSALEQVTELEEEIVELEKKIDNG